MAAQASKTISATPRNFRASSIPGDLSNVAQKDVVAPVAHEFQCGHVIEAG